MAARSLKISALVIMILGLPVWGLPDSSEKIGQTSGLNRSGLKVSIHVVIVSNDNGQRIARVTPSQFSRWVEFANRTYQDAKIHFDFSPSTNVSFLKSSILNRVTGINDANWKEAKILGNKIAAGFMDSLVVFCRFGPDEGPTGAGFSWTDYNFVVMPGFSDARHCGHDHVDALAHEIGHYLGLPHTFVQESFQNRSEAEDYFKLGGQKRAVFDGDGFTDTAPDPAIRSLECDRVKNIVLGGLTFRLPRRNIMSYYDERDCLTPMQMRRARWVLQKRMGNHMSLPRNTVVVSPIEMESLAVTSRKRCQSAYQSMSAYGIADWSDEAQLFVAGQGTSSVTLALPVQTTGSYRCNLFATQAPDFGIIQVILDGQILASIDLYAPLVMPTGRISLGTVSMKKGKRNLTFRCNSKNQAASGFRYGIDCIELIQ
ncbi:M43 family zinc metalloprotease [candidate division CSSED10-310 bacterium]|uniref:M43 family zinc metalloprotease n=1 Tax=candidate division CSSED10-310 bacterium TaxID=2855610 RepID=A0ABV6Z4E0_UNCC1